MDPDKVENLDDCCKAVRSDVTDSLKNDEVYDYLANVTEYREFINNCVHPPVKPNGGSIFIFDLGPDEAQWEERKKKLRYEAAFNFYMCIIICMCTYVMSNTIYL